MRFDEFAIALLPGALRLATALTGDQASAEDIVQEVMLRAHRRWATISQLDRPDSYVRTMIVNEFISTRRRTWRLIPSGRATDLDTEVMPDHAAKLADRAALIAELGKLPRRQRAVLVLRYYEGLSDQSIAELLGTSPVTVRGYAFRALAKLRIELAPAAGQGGQPDGQPAACPSPKEETSCLPKNPA
jgi:RNA polymerase sigma-70 factor (sigma-E family)